MVNGLGHSLRNVAQWLPPAFVRPFGRPVALFFHGVERRICNAAVQSNQHDSAAFYQIVRLLRDNYDVLPLAAIKDVLARPEQHRRSVFLMSDDGYANNLSLAADILQDAGLPWTLFVSTRHIDTGERNPIFLARLFFLFAPQGRYAIANLVEPVELGSPEQRHAVAAVWIDRLRALDAARATEAVAAMQSAFAPADLAALLDKFRSDSFLSWPQVAMLKSRGVEIGAHAHHHWPMHDGQTREYLREQATLSRTRIEAETGGTCRYFAYPFGNVSDVCREAWHAVRDAGYEYGFTTLSGSLDASRNPFLMPRYGLGPREPRLPSLVPFLRAGNRRLIGWQRLIGD